MQCTAAGTTQLGSREQNQDSMLIDMAKGLFAVADGVGGGYRGEVASAIGVAEVASTPPTEPLRVCAERAQEKVLADALLNIGQALMGSTLTALRIKDGFAELAHVGDSRCYVYERPLLRLLTVDHEVYDEAAGQPVLSSYLGIAPEVAPITIFEERIPLEGPVLFLLCSDGLYKQLTEERIVELIEEEPDLQKLVDRMAEEAVVVQYSDNVTIVAIRVIP